MLCKNVVLYAPYGMEMFTQNPFSPLHCQVKGCVYNECLCDPIQGFISFLGKDTYIQT